MDPQTDTQFLQVKILSPKEVIFEGPVFAVSSKNTSGDFDILPQHANFITLLQGVPITVKKPKNETATFNFPLAIIYASNNKVTIFTEIQLDFGPN
ncbi:hypothetical protein A3E45_04110 [Candidatus Daviesbacteria bacterium RIFCSPHIGHO2_12_FULL_43_11]|uniref:ATP synthase F1 complex delta/epsilon subunit N-terminal domain-containing protein n=2 Tax=Candidatus Daviesiibacteriota TaxID=1752718 RepID=A0A1F5K620_9BACT|nr:MAG: ATP synthase, Delta/Epsilon chain, beta-sandwich-like protein [Candidatus Daviesbacteria bacterium GW2011_GWA2_42_7]OGE19479.1 MAG: hypothetical protein A2874_02170 [Candidatus Daviesbacteria bacterium RIFCSPHIGHO2_01_FULL_43_17]OGE36248.1 MAG: hypothetical protein A3E45_04110 [Candidatus Daviesbacteria bacterium RIFCSPHIGHO2_12_FULL_43_11]OGE70086.1 MAG: hypothetical protein A3J21_03400 [Candidatus Daviesbacteria bacterium RIFCSPLOWO2_02_FULL_43_11]